MPLVEYQQLAAVRKGAASTSANIPFVEESKATGEVAELYDNFRTYFGRQEVPGILKCFATHPPLLRHMLELSKEMVFAEGSLGRLHKEMIATFISTQNACAYCADSHGYFLRFHGGTPASLCAIQQDDLTSPALTPAVQALLAFCGKVNRQSQEISPADISTMAAAGWSELQIAEAVHITALFATFNRVVSAFGLPSQNLLSLYSGQPEPAA